MRNRMVALRLPEALLVAGFTFVGAVMAAPSLPVLASPRSAAFFLASYFVIVSIYAFNSWAGFPEDTANPRLADSLAVSRHFFATASLVTFIGAFFLFGAFSSRGMLSAVAVWVMWGLYSFPRYGAKYHPPLGTIAHFFIGIIQFHQGWILFSVPDKVSFILSCYFGLLLSAGHLNHEMIDCDADRAAGVANGAARFGLRGWIFLHLFVALCAGALLAVIIAAHLPLRVRLVPFCIASLGHLLSAFLLLFNAQRAPLSFLRHRTRYRLLYGLGGAATLLFLIP